MPFFCLTWRGTALPPDMRLLKLKSVIHTNKQTDMSLSDILSGSGESASRIYKFKIQCYAKRTSIYGYCVMKLVVNNKRYCQIVSYVQYVHLCDFNRNGPARPRRQEDDTALVPPDHHKNHPKTTTNASVFGWIVRVRRPKDTEVPNSPPQCG